VRRGLPQLGWDVAAEDDEAGGRVPRARRGAIRHRRALREAGVDQRVAGGVPGADVGHHLLDVAQVVGDRLLASELRHPAGDDVCMAPLVEPVQRLHGDQQPRRRSRNPFELAQVHRGVLSVAVESDQQRVRALGLGRAGDVTSLRCRIERRDDGVGGHQASSLNTAVAVRVAADP
tara:strand:+ start:10557 stop:11084 length:528 start_codon:yes stop_codon:yes gene_type:complete